MIVQTLLRFNATLILLTSLTHNCLASHHNGSTPEPLATSDFVLNFNEPIWGDSPKIAELQTSGNPSFTRGLSGSAMRFQKRTSLTIKPFALSIGRHKDFSVSFWIRTIADDERSFIVASQKDIPDLSLKSQKQSGWAFFVYKGTWGWNIGTGNRRLTYKRSNGEFMKINDGRWHQLAMTYHQQQAAIRLYFDGVNWATYNVKDERGFDFTSDQPVVIGWDGNVSEKPTVHESILNGQKLLQDLVDAFNALELSDLQADELLELVINPKPFTRTRGSAENIEFSDALLERLDDKASSLMKNPYTIHQVADFMKVAPLSKIYELAGGKIVLKHSAASAWSDDVKLDAPDFAMDDFSFWNRTLSSKEILHSYELHFPVCIPSANEETKHLTASAFNIHHGGIHETVEEDGWDSRKAIIQLLQQENIDIIMMQETYSAGDFIAAELGYYFATTVDWDNLNQGANISVLSKYPITKIHVPPKSAFMNVAAKIELSESQEIYAMSNWYGMRNFSDVYEFHEARFENAESIPILFAGDFNSVPHTDGGNSPASQKLLANGFTDAFRSLYPDVQKHPGGTHIAYNDRIDQLYYKGSGLKNISTSVISTWPTKFPSDHFLIKSKFQLN